MGERVKNCINSIENYFKQNWSEVLDKGINLDLTPIDTVEIIYYYLQGKKNETDRDTLMHNIADITLSELTSLLKKIKQDLTTFIN